MAICLNEPINGGINLQQWYYPTSNWWYTEPPGSYVFDSSLPKTDTCDKTFTVDYNFDRFYAYIILKSYIRFLFTLAA